MKILRKLIEWGVLDEIFKKILDEEENASKKRRKGENFGPEYYWSTNWSALYHNPESSKKEQ